MSKKKTLKLISWNVNGIRACIRKGLIDFIKNESADIFCFQETRAQRTDVDLGLPGYEQYWNEADKKGYSGTATLTRIKPLSVKKGMGVKKHEGEGRVLTLEFEAFFLVNVYTPNSKRDLSRLSYRCGEWDADFLKYIKKLQKKKPVIFCGDLNVAHKEIDLKNPKANVKNHGFTPEERAGFDNIVKAGFVDTFRVFNEHGGNYTWWSQLFKARERNVGWRIDYVCVSEPLKEKLKSASIYSKVMGSDHCPVGIELKL